MKVRDSGMPDACVDYVMLFNILHHERPAEIIKEAYRILRPGGALGAIHWVHSAATPRGSALEIRQRAEARDVNRVVTRERVSTSAARAACTTALAFWNTFFQIFAWIIGSPAAFPLFLCVVS